jgi:hypothetical protein
MERDHIQSQVKEKRITAASEKHGAKHAKSHLTTKRKDNADDVRRKASTYREKRSKQQQDTHHSKRKAWKHVHESRAFESPKSKALEYAESPSPSPPKKA